MMSNPIILDTGAPELLVDQIRRRLGLSPYNITLGRDTQASP